MKTLFIFGEDHSDPINIQRIHDTIREIKPAIILHELLYTDACNTAADIRNRLRNCEVGDICDPTLNRDVYELGLELSAKLIGIDAPFDKNLSLDKQFQIREDHMVSMIEKYIDQGVVAVVVGDAHLRETRTKELGRMSPIVAKYRNNATILHPNDLLKRLPTSFRW